jgi:hypothetical protein
LFVLTLALCAPASWAQLSGEVEWGYAHYKTSGGAYGDRTASHFTQRYSLMNNTKGLIAGGRAGFYDIGIGGEWTAFDTDMNGTKLSEDSLKVLYEGRVQIAPGGLPFRLNAYSYDLSKSGFQADFIPHEARRDDVRVSYGLFRPRIVTNLTNGQTIVSGVQFMAGIRNGSYLGKYRELLSKWPRVLVDYRDVYHRDMTSLAPSKYRDRNLAFVSLNKKDNWFHYRLYEHHDYLRSNSDTKESTILLGTIDHTMKRQWINMTNWIRLSVDGSFTKTERDWDNLDNNLYSLNFFTLLNRRKFSASSFLNLQREQIGSTTANRLDVPVFVTNHLDRDNTVHSTFQHWHEERNSDRLDRETKADYAKIMHEGFKTRRVQVNSTIEMEVDSGDIWDGQAVRGTVEAYSNRLLRQPFAFHSLGSVAIFDGENGLGFSTDFWESLFEGGLNYRSRNIEAGANQLLLYGDGSYDLGSPRYMHTELSSGFKTSYADSGNRVKDSLFRSETTLYAEHLSPSRVKNRLQLVFKFQDQDGEKLDNTALEHRMDYQARLWDVALINLYSTGDDSNYKVSSSGNLQAIFDAQPFEQMFRHETKLKYSPNRYWKSKFDADFTWGKGESGERNYIYTFEQELERTFYAFNSVRRKRGDISQYARYSQFKDGIDKRELVFSLAGNYYPTRYWRMGGTASYYDYNFREDYMTLSLTTGLDFPLFQVDFTYDYGKAFDSNVIAHRYEVNVRKRFN